MLGTKRPNKAVSSQSVHDLYVQSEQNRKRKHQKAFIHREGPGIGPSPFAEQGYRVINVDSNEPAGIRAETFEECTAQNWIPNIQDTNNVHCIQKGELLFRAVNISFGHVRGRKALGRQMPHVFSGMQNLKDVVDVEFVGVCRNPGASKGRQMNNNDNAAVCFLGGTATIPNSGPYHVKMGDKGYAFKQSYTVPKSHDPTGRSGYATSCPMKGIARDKLLPTVIPLPVDPSGKLIESEYFIVSSKLRDLLYEVSGNKKKTEPPQSYQVGFLLDQIKTEFEQLPKGKVPYLAGLVYIFMLDSVIRHAVGMRLAEDEHGSVDLDQNDKWKTLIADIYVLLAEEIKRYFMTEQQKLPKYQDITNWKFQLPFVLDYTYKKEDAFKYMPNMNSTPITQVQHTLNAATYCMRAMTILTNGELSRAFIGTFISDAKPTDPVDLDIKR